MFISDVIPLLIKRNSEILGNISLFPFLCPKRSSGEVWGLRAWLVKRFLRNIKKATISRAQLVFLTLKQDGSWVFNHRFCRRSCPCSLRRGVSLRGIAAVCCRPWRAARPGLSYGGCRCVRPEEQAAFGGSHGEFAVVYIVFR